VLQSRREKLSGLSNCERPRKEWTGILLPRPYGRGRLGDWATLGDGQQAYKSTAVAGASLNLLGPLARRFPRCEEEPLAAPKQGDVESLDDVLSTGTLGEFRVRTGIASRLQIDTIHRPPWLIIPEFTLNLCQTLASGCKQRPFQFGRKAAKAGNCNGVESCDRGLSLSRVE
jgi:hypothetical protein